MCLNLNDCLKQVDINCYKPTYVRASQVALKVKNQPVNSRDIRDVGSTPESGRPPAGGHGNNPLQYSLLENTMDREAWRAEVHRVAQSQT